MKVCVVHKQRRLLLSAVFVSSGKANVHRRCELESESLVGVTCGEMLAI